MSVLTHDGENDYTLNPEHESVWVTVGGLSVYIVTGDRPGVMVEVYEHGKEMEDSLAYCEAMEGDTDED